MWVYRRRVAVERPCFKRGWTVNRARKDRDALMAVAIVPTAAGAARRPASGPPCSIVSLAAAAHQGWSANGLYAREATCSPSGRGVGLRHRRLRRRDGGVLFQWLTGRYSTRPGGNYASIFASADLPYVTAWTIITCWRQG